MKKLLTLAAASIATLGLAFNAQAEYPTGPVQFIVPWPPGDFEDILTRMIAANMQEATGVPASVVNRPGGGDGPFPGDNDVVLGHFGAGLTPTKATFAAAKNMGFEFADDSAFDMLDCNTLSAGDADVINTTLALIEPCLDTINVLANIGEAPIAKLDGVDTLAAQSGINDLELWNGLFVTKGTPQEVIDTLAEIGKATMMSDEAQQLMAETGAAVYWQGMEESMARIVADSAKDAELAAIIAGE